jgi:hypothetical protein
VLLAWRWEEKFHNMLMAMSKLMGIFSPRSDERLTGCFGSVQLRFY